MLSSGRSLLLSGLAAGLMALLFCSCNVPDPVPAATSTLDQTATPVLPTATPTTAPTATCTPLPDYLQIAPEDLSGTGLTLRYNLDGDVRGRLEEMVTLFNDENPYGITVRAVRANSADELHRQLSGEDPGETDLVIAGSAWLRSLNADKSLLLDVSAFLDTPETALKRDDITELMQVMLASEVRDEGTYAIPLWAEPSFLFYNKTWAIELGYPDTPADLASFAEQVCAAGRANYQDKDNGKHGTGGWIVSSAPEDAMSWLLIFARNGETPGTILREDTGEIFTETAIWLRNLFDNGCAWNSRVKEPYDYFANRYALFYSGTYLDAERQYNAFEQSETHGFDNWDLVVYPVRSDDPEITPRIYGSITSAAITAGTDARRTAAAWQFIRWLYQGTHAAELSLAAKGWPVQDNDEITKLYRRSGEDKLYQTLSYRQYLVSNDADENWLTDQRILSDGFDYIFNPSSRQEDIPGIWEQIGSIIAEINSINDLSESSTSEEIIETGGNYEK